MVKKILLLIFLVCIGINLYGKTDSLLRQEVIKPLALSVATPVLSNSANPSLDSIIVKPDVMFLPIIFEKQKTIVDTIAREKFSLYPKPYKLNVDYDWLKEEMRKTKFSNFHMYKVIVEHPQIVRLNTSMLPEPPKQYVFKSEPNKITMTLEELVIKDAPKEVPAKAEIKLKSWITNFNASLQFSQAYLSSNWYQGGISNLNLFSNILYAVKLNQNVHPKLLFENTIQYKLSLSSAPQDSLRSYSISEDLFQVNTKFGIKAINHWFYTATMQFKTQIFNNYQPNTNDLKASFLTPGELNFGLGMTYNSKSKNNKASFDISFAPISYNMKICRETDRFNASSLGIDEGKHIASQIGSNLEGRIVWVMSPNITYSCRLFAFTNYEYLQGDLENTFDFSINKYLSTRLYLHLRYDSSTELSSKWKHWQFKEILSFGFNYKI